MSEHVAYRVENSGDFSGSAYRYHSLLAGTLEGVRAFLCEMWSSFQEAMIMVTKGFTAVLEVIQSGERISR